MNEIQDYLQKHNARLEANNRLWMVWDGGIGSWEVYEQPYGKKVRIKGSARNITEALKMLELDEE